MNRRFSHSFACCAQLGLLALLVLSPRLASAQFAAFARTQPQFAVANVLDTICGVSATGDLQNQCDGFGAVLGNGNEDLTLQQFAQEEYASNGNLAVEFSNRQKQAVVARLQELREGGDEPSDTRETFSLAGLGVYLSPNAAFGKHDGSAREDPFDVVSAGFIAGADHWIGERGIVGAAFRYEYRDLDFDSVGRVSGGGVDVYSYGGSLYGSFDARVVQLDAVMSFTWSNLDQERRLVSQTPAYPLNRTTRSDTAAQTYGVALAASRGWNWGALLVAPLAELSYQALLVDSFTERGAQGLDLRVDSQTVHSLQSRLGARVAYAISTDVGVLLPQLRGSWRHEYLHDRRDLDARFLADAAGVDVLPRTDNPDRNYFNLGASLSFTLPRGFQPYVDYQTVLGLRNVSHHIFRLGLRVEI